jgi:HTH-type transcriptional regulator/antitoxin HigA
MKTIDFEIKTEEEFEDIMARIEQLMDKGETNLSTLEAASVRKMAEAAQEFEQRNYRVAMPDTLPEMISLRMYEMKIRQKEAAKRLGISDAKLSLILSGKQKPDVHFIREIYLKLNIPADFILTHI